MFVHVGCGMKQTAWSLCDVAHCVYILGTNTGPCLVFLHYKAFNLLWIIVAYMLTFGIVSLGNVWFYQPPGFVCGPHPPYHFLIFNGLKKHKWGCPPPILVGSIQWGLRQVSVCDDVQHVHVYILEPNTIKQTLSISLRRNQALLWKARLLNVNH